MNVQAVRPQVVTADGLARQNTLIVRAPALSLPAELSSADTHRLGQDLAALSSNLGSDVALRSKFDQSWLRASDDERESFLDRLNEEKGAALATIPHALDWIWETMSADHRERLTNEIDEVLVVGYPQEEESAVTSAVDRCVELTTDSATGNTALTQSAIRDNLETLTYTHSFQNEDLSTRIGTYGPTIVPDLVTTLSTSSWQSGLSMVGIKQACRDIAEGFTLREFFVDTTTSFRDAAGSIPTELPSEALPSIAEWATTIGADTLPWGGTASLLIWSAIRDGDGVSGEEVIRQLAELNLLPTARASLETEAGLPPRTLDIIAGPESDAFIAKLRSAISDEKLPEVALDIQGEDRASEFAVLEDTVDRLDEEIDSFAGLYSEHLDSAVHSLDIIDEQLVSDETRLIGSLIDKDSLTTDDIPYLDSAGEDAALATAVTDISEAVSDGALVILNGPRGTGKTSAAYEVGVHLEQYGYSIIVPNLQEHAAGFVKQAIRKTGQGRQRVLYASLEVGPPRTRVSRQDLATLVNWLEQGVCHAVILECRSEMSQILQSRLNDLAVRSRGPETAEIEFAPFEKSEQGQELIDWVIGQADAATIDATIRSEILTLADGNPEILKLATRFAISDDESLAELSTARELVLTDLQSLFDRSGRPRELYERVVVLLAVSGGLSTAQLGAALEMSRSDLRAKLTDLRGYLANPVRTQLADRSMVLPENAQWELSPDVYADATLQQCVLQEGGYDFWWAFNTLFTESHEDAKFSFQLLYVARRLGITFSAARTRGDKELMTAVQDIAQATVNRVNTDCGPVLFQKVLRLIIDHGVPLPPRLVEDNSSKLMQGIREADKDILIGSPVAGLHRNLGFLLAAHVNRDESPNEVIKVSTRLAEWAGHRFGYLPKRFLSNVYRLGIPALFEMGFGESDDALERMHSLIHSSAQSTTIPERFLSNTYASSLAAADFYGKYEGDPPWLGYINSCLWETALNEQNDINPAWFIAETYGSAIHKYAFIFESGPTEWLPNMFNLIEESITEDSELDATACDLLQAVYRTAASEMEMTQERDISTEWLAALLQRIDEIAASPWQKDDPEEFSQNVFAGVIAGAASSNPQVTGGWSSDIVGLCLQQISGNDVNQLYQRTLETLAKDELDEQIAWIVADCFERFDPAVGEDQPPKLCFETVTTVSATALERIIEINSRVTAPDSDSPKVTYLNHQIAEQVGQGLLLNIPDDRLPDTISELSTIVECDSDGQSEDSVAASDRVEGELVAIIYTIKINLAPRASDQRQEILNEALEVAETTTASRLTMWLLLKHAIVGVGVSWSINSPPEYYQILLEQAQSRDTIPYEEFLVDTTKQICRETGADSKCASYVAGDALKQWSTEQQCHDDWLDEMVEIVATAVDDAFYVSEPFEIVIDPVLNAIQTIEETNPETVAELVPAVEATLEDEFNNYVGAIDWRAAATAKTDIDR